MAFQDPVMPSEAPPPREQKDWADYLTAGLQIAGGVAGGVLGSAAGPAGVAAGAMVGAGAGQALGGLFNPYSDTGPQQVVGGLNTTIRGGMNYADVDAERRKAAMASQAQQRTQGLQQGQGQLGGYPAQPTPQLAPPTSVYDYNKRLP